jgi:hypothetical protein
MLCADHACRPRALLARAWGGLFERSGSTAEKSWGFPDLSIPGFFDFTHCRLFPLEYRLPTRFEMIPLRPISQAMANTGPPLDEGVAEHEAVDAGDER